MINKETSNPSFPYLAPQYIVGARALHRDGSEEIMSYEEFQEAMDDEDFCDSVNFQVMCDCDKFARDWIDAYAFLLIAVRNKFGDIGWREAE